MFRKLIWGLDIMIILSMIVIFAGNNVSFFQPLMVIYNSFNLLTGIFVLIISLFMGLAIFLLKSGEVEVDVKYSDRFKFIDALKEFDNKSNLIPSIIRNAIIVVLSFMIKENSIAAVTIFSFSSVMILRDRMIVYTNSLVDKIKET
jgi:hypothetical protein